MEGKNRAGVSCYAKKSGSLTIPLQTDHGGFNIVLCQKKIILKQYWCKFNFYGIEHFPQPWALITLYCKNKYLHCN